MLSGVDRYIVKGISTDRSFLIFRVSQTKKPLALTLETKALNSFQTVAIVYHKTFCDIPDDLTLRSLVDKYRRLEDTSASKFREADFKNIHH